MDLDKEVLDKFNSMIANQGNQYGMIFSDIGK